MLDCNCRSVEILLTLPCNSAEGQVTLVEYFGWLVPLNKLL